MNAIAELEQLAAEMESFARRLRAIADRESNLDALKAAQHIVAAANELGVELRP